MATVIWKETKYGCSLLTALYQLQQGNVMCDLQIKSKNLIIPVHKLVLHAFNDTIYTNELKEPGGMEDLVAKCGDFDSHIVLALIQYLYTGEVVIEKNEIEPFFELCKNFKLETIISGIQEECNRIEKCLSRRTFPSKGSDHQDNVKDPDNKVNDMSVQSTDPSRNLEDSLMKLNTRLMMEVKEEPVDSFHHEMEASDYSNQSIGESTKKSSEESITNAVKNGHKQKDCAINLRMCSLCSKIFEKDHEYVNHMEAEHELYTCSMCDFQHQNKSNLTKHIKSKHNCDSETSSNSQTNKMFIYDNNEGKTENKQTRVSPGVIKEECSICNKVVRKDKMVCHKRTHNAHLLCPLCPAKFTEEWDFKDHTRRHGNPYVCDICGENFISRHRFKYHKKKHTGKYVFTCEHCGKKFMTISHYEGHVNQVHLNIHPYKCKFCENEFSYRASLARHTRECKLNPNQEKKEFMCDQCNVVCVTLRTLEDHIEAKHTKIVHTCVCGKEYAWKRSYTRHLLKCRLK